MTVVNVRESQQAAPAALTVTARHCSRSRLIQRLLLSSCVVLSAAVMCLQAIHAVTVESVGHVEVSTPLGRLRGTIEQYQTDIDGSNSLQRAHVFRGIKYVSYRKQCCCVFPPPPLSIHSFLCIPID
jgi:hypothetical protein